MKKALSLAGNVVFAVMILFVLALLFIVLSDKIDRGNGHRAAGYRIYVVLSGSMKPVFDAGSVIAVKGVDPKTVAVGDIITFSDPEDGKRNVTHRVTGIQNKDGALSFVTKGDANEEADFTPVPAANVLGRTICWVPYAGFLVEFAKGKKGLLLFLIIPGVFFILLELKNLFKYAREYEAEQKEKKAEKEAVKLENPNRI